MTYCHSAVGEFMLGQARSSGLSSLDSDSTSYTVVSIRSTLDTGSEGCGSFEIHGSFASSNTSLVSQIDNFVWHNYTPPWCPRREDTSLLGQATLVRAYLCFMFSTNMS